MPAAHTRPDQSGTGPVPPSTGAEPSSGRVWWRPPPRVPTTREDLRAAGLVVLALALLGLPLGVLWRVLTPRVEMLRVDGGFVLTQENPEQYMAADGVFMLLTGGAGIIAAVVVWFALRGRRGTLVLAGLAIGSIASTVVAWRFGRIGRDEYQASIVDDEALYQVGWRVWRAPELLMTDFDVTDAFASLGSGDVAGMWSHLSLGVLAAMGVVAVTIYTMCAAWSRFTSLRGPDPYDTPPTIRNDEANRD